MSKPEKEAPAEGEALAIEGASEGKNKKKKMIIIIAAVLVLLIGGGAGAYFMGLFGGEKHEAEGEHAEGKKEGEHAGPVYFNLPEFLVNLNSGGKQASFLKATVVIELGSPEDQKAVEANLPRILDVFNTYLREMRPADLVGSAGIFRLREELLTRINKTVAPVKVNDVLFKEILVQ